MGETVQLRSRAAQVLGGAMVAVGAGGLLLLAIEGGTALLQFGAPSALFGALGWAAFWQPYVEVSDGGVLVANTLRSVRVPWPAVDSVHGRYGLSLATSYGVVTAWAAPAPSSRQRASGQQGSIAQTVEQRLEELRDAGHLIERRLERPALETTWHVPTLATVAVLTVATVVLPLLT